MHKPDLWDLRHAMQVRMAVCVMRVVPARYAFVIHTKNPQTNDSSEVWVAWDHVTPTRECEVPVSGCALDRRYACVRARRPCQLGERPLAAIVSLLTMVLCVCNRPWPLPATRPPDFCRDGQGPG
jgi:hypothetical protein